MKRCSCGPHRAMNREENVKDGAREGGRRDMQRASGREITMYTL